MEDKRKPQRQPPYSVEQRRYFADLVQQHGARGAREILARQVSLHTLLKISSEFQIRLRKGRRPASIVLQAPSAADCVSAGSDSQAIRFQPRIPQNRIQ